MRRSRRTQFAASFVAVVAAGCSHEHTGSGTGTASGSGSSPPPKPTASWSVMLGNDGATCYATPHIDCPPGGPSCNPPASTAIACPTPMPQGGFGIVSFDGTSCFLASDQKTPIACPGSEPPPPAPPDAPAAAPPAPAGRTWSIVQGNHDSCFAMVDVSCPPNVSCNPPPAIPVKCPPFAPGVQVFEMSPGKCQFTYMGGGGNCPPNMQCNPPPPREVDVACPRP